MKHEGKEAGVARIHKLAKSAAERGGQDQASLPRHAGMGMLVDERHILTCAHVIDDALRSEGADRGALDKNTRVLVSFPLLSFQRYVEAHVTVWYPMVETERLSDIAVLELSDPAPAPQRQDKQYLRISKEPRSTATDLASTDSQEITLLATMSTQISWGLQ